MNILSVIKKTRFLLAVIAFLLFNLDNIAQTPGLIIDPATGNGTFILDPDSNGYSSASSSGFSLNDETESEIPFIPMVFPASEPNSDLGPGPDCGYSDFVQQTAGIQDAGQYYYNPVNHNWFFRMRLGNVSTNSKSYSILIDTDEKFGSSGANADPNYLSGNPGFEIELVLATNFGVYVYDVNGTTSPVLKKNFSGHTNYQKSIALSTNCSNPDYFYDFYVPFDSIANWFGINTSTNLRMVLIDNMAAQSSSIGHLTSVSDLGGVNDATYGYNYESIFSSAINNYTPTCASCPAGLNRSTCPSLNRPILTGATSVSGTTASPDGTTITLYKNGVSIGTTTSSGGSWTKSGISPALASGQIIGASATESGKGESVFNCQLVTVSACTTLTSLVSANVSGNTKGVCGTAGTGISGAGIHVYVDGVLLVPVGGDTITIRSDGSFIWKCNTSATGCTSASPCISNNTDVQVIQSLNGCSSDPICVRIGSGSTTTTAAPVILNSPVITNTSSSISGTSVSGATIFLYADGAQIANGTSSGTSWTINSLTLTTGQVLTAKAVITGNCLSSASAPVTVSRISAAPVITGSYCTSTNISTVTGTSTEAAGTVVQVYDNGVVSGTTTSVDAYGVWSKSGLSIAKGHNITAKATIAGGTISVASNTVMVESKLSSVVNITTPTITEGDASVSGTGTNGNMIRLYIDGIQIGTSVTVSGGTWTVGSLGVYDLFTGGIVTATADSAGMCESDPSAGKTVVCLMPSNTLTVEPSSASTCLGSIVTNIQILSSQTGVIYQLYDGAVKSGSSKVGNGGTLSLTSGGINSNTTLTVKAIKVSSSTCETFLTDNVPVTLLTPDSTWTGMISSDWFNPSNWCLEGNIPTSSTSITILAGTPYQPVISSSGAVCKSITISAGATLTAAASNNLDIYGDWTNNGTFVPNTGIVSFKGITNQNIGGASASNTFNNLTINNTGTTGNDFITLNKPITINGILTLTDGRVNTDAVNLLTIAAGGSSSAGNSSSFINGPMAKSGNSSFIFPIGNGSRFEPLGIGTPTSSSTLMAQYFSNSFSNVTTMAGSPSPVLNDVSSLEYWQLLRTTGSGDAAITLYWKDAAFSQINDCSDLRVASWNGSGWQNNNNVCNTTGTDCPSPSTGSGNILTNTTVSLSATNVFTFGSLSSLVNTLPVSLGSFNAECSDRNVLVEWTTLSEINHESFTIERKINSGEFIPIGVVKGTGNSGKMLHYEFIDKIADLNSPESSIIYYRLILTDQNGKTEYSKIIPLTHCFENGKGVSLYPNISNGTLHIKGSINEINQLTLFDFSGKVVYQSLITSNQTDIHTGMVPGIYYYLVSAGEEITGKGKLIFQ